MKLETYAHSKGLSLAHFQFTPAYRRNVFPDDQVKYEIVDCFRKDAEKLGIRVVALGFGPDHMHAYFGHWKNYAIPKLAQQFKGHSSRVVREKHWDRISDKLWGNKFWTAGYFFETAGAVAPENLEWYVAKGQMKHWRNRDEFKEVKLIDGQASLLDYN